MCGFLHHPKARIWHTFIYWALQSKCDKKGPILISQWSCSIVLTWPSRENLKGGLCLITLVARRSSPVSPSSSMFPSWWSRISLLDMHIQGEKERHSSAPLTTNTTQIPSEIPVGKAHLWMQSARCLARASKSSRVVWFKIKKMEYK